MFRSFWRWRLEAMRKGFCFCNYNKVIFHLSFSSASFCNTGIYLRWCIADVLSFFVGFFSFYACLRKFPLKKGTDGPYGGCNSNLSSFFFLMLLISILRLIEN